VHHQTNKGRALFGGGMHFEYRGFNIECSATDGGAGFVGIATIYQASADGEDRKVFTSGLLRSFPTFLQAVDYARVWAEIWCDGQLTPAWAATVPRKPRKKHE
jgi:hypothetical protein